MVDNDTLMEVKCLYDSINILINPENVSYLKLTTNNELELDRRHTYYTTTKFRASFVCAERSQCDLAIYTIENIKDKDAEFLSNSEWEIVGI